MRAIEIIGANENNLKNINVNIPLNKVTVVTGVSGSGKSSLVFDTIYAESERRLLESISVSSKNSVDLKKPNVYKVNNLIPAIAISQKQTNRNPRSTVGTVTDIALYIRRLFSKVATLNTGEIWMDSDFSYNNPKVWCDCCKGTGEEYIIDEEKIIDKSKSINDGAIPYWNETNSNYYDKLLGEVAKHYDINLNTPLEEMQKEKLEFILHGISDINFNIRYKNYKNKYRTKSVKFIGLFREVEEKLNDIDTPSTFKSIQKFLTKEKCSICNGGRLKQEILDIKIYDKNIAYINNISVSELKKWLIANSRTGDLTDKVFKEITEELIRRIENLEKLKLGHLTLDRSVPTLSGGEAQRLRLTNQLAGGLSGVLYVLDEPTMGLHANDIKCINDIISELKMSGNTILMVEHNAEIMINADKIIDMGPKGGIYGGEIIFNGTPTDIIKDINSETGIYLQNYKTTKKYSDNSNYDKFISVKGATYNNVVDQDFNIPLNQLVVITGVSGAGKSTITEYILEPSLGNRKNVNCKSIVGINNINKVIKVDQSPIGRSPKSNIATYAGLFDLIRDLFSKTEEAKKGKLTKSDFSFNVDGGRCDKCKGDGNLKVEMNFMPDVYIECDECKGRRYKENILEVKYNEKNIDDVLNMTVVEGYNFFKSSKKISAILQCLIDVGLDYVKIGQSALTISGGEAQRIKLAKYLSDESTKRILYILDEPSVGLHYSDTKKLIVLLKKIVQRGNSVVVVEHNLDIIKESDYIIDMGEVGGPLGGKIVDVGTPLEIKTNGKASVAKML